MYTTPYDPDAEAALQRLREETFARGAYPPIGGIHGLPRDQDLRGDVPVWFRVLMAGFRTISAISVAVHWFARGGRQPRSIEELFAICRENGTHSILDIAQTADFPTSFAATPLTKAKLLKFFGTVTPTYDQVERATEWKTDLGDDIPRWEAVYFAVHDETGEPREYWFLGVSGD
jgi:hypothetical protein